MLYCEKRGVAMILGTWDGELSGGVVVWWCGGWG